MTSSTPDDDFLESLRTFKSRIADAPGEPEIRDNGVFVRAEENPDVFITVTLPDDPAQALLKNPDIRSTPNKDIYKSSCYICVDPEFAQMGMPLCYPCSECGGHIAADDTICDDCGLDAFDLYLEGNIE